MASHVCRLTAPLLSCPLLPLATVCRYQQMFCSKQFVRLPLPLSTEMSPWGVGVNVSSLCGAKFFQGATPTAVSAPRRRRRQRSAERRTLHARSS